MRTGQAGVRRCQTGMVELGSGGVGEEGFCSCHHGSGGHVHWDVARFRFGRDSMFNIFTNELLSTIVSAVVVDEDYSCTGMGKVCILNAVVTCMQALFGV